MFQIIFGALISLFKNEQLKKQVPKKIGDYRLISEIERKNDFHRFALGIYENNKREKVFIKTWIGKIKDVNYHLLINEYNVNRVIYKKLSESRYQNKIRIPKILDISINSGLVSLIFEYTDGKSLEYYPIKYQADTILGCYSFFTEISNILNENEKKSFMLRTSWFYILSFPFMAALLALKHPRNSKKIFKSFLEAFSSIEDLFNRDLVIAHRDLSPKNILVKDGIVFIIDFEKTVLTTRYYDQIFISTEPNFRELNEIITSEYILKNTFLKTYMATHFALYSKNAQSLFDHYISML